MAEVKKMVFTDQSGLPDIEYVSEPTVEPWMLAGSDAHFVAAARVSTSKHTEQMVFGERLLASEGMPLRDHALLQDLIKSQHSGPFAHGLVSVYIDAPLFVWAQLGTHPELKRSRESARYRTLRNRFYIPSIERAAFEAIGFVPMRPVFHSGVVTEHEQTVERLLYSYAASWRDYVELRNGGVAREIARGVLPDGIMSTGIVSASPLFWLRALSVRTQTEASKRVSHVQYETADVFMRVDAIMREEYPLTMAAFDAAGRVSP